MSLRSINEGSCAPRDRSWTFRRLRARVFLRRIRRIFLSESYSRSDIVIRLIDLFNKMVCMRLRSGMGNFEREWNL